MRLIFIRHGDPDYVHDTLTEKGKREAELLAQRVKNWDVSKFYVSPLGRAQLTAEYSMKLRGDTAETLPWLREFNGIIPTSDGGHRIPWDMYPTEWADKEIYYDRNNWFKSDYMQTGNVEEQLKWVHEGIDKLLADHGYIHENGMFRIEKHSDETLVFFCHFGVSMVMIGHILGISTMNMWHGFNMQPTSVTVLGCEEREGDYGFSDATSWAVQSTLQAAMNLSPTQATSPTFSGLNKPVRVTFSLAYYCIQKYPLSALLFQGGYFIVRNLSLR